MINFHRALIATAILFCALFAGWAFAAYGRTDEGVHLGLGTSFAIVTVALAYYLKNLKRFLRR
jgi:hypothetical protein